MTKHTEQLPDSEIGERLRLARESAKVTQATAAKTETRLTGAKSRTGL